MISISINNKEVTTKSCCSQAVLAINPVQARIKVERTFFRSGSLAWYGACGASILNSRVVMTAAHCLVYGDGIESLENPTNIKVLNSV